MARFLRIEYPNACYHVMNRGNRQEQIFFENQDYLLFLKKLSEYCILYNVEIHSYCLMPNHFHLQLQTRHENLSKFMQSFITSFTLSINKKQEKSGHLFQGRYKAQLIESELYKNKLSRYIHLNPIKLESFKDLPLKQLKNYLHDFRWSSFRSYIGLEKMPDWLNRNHVLSSWGNSATQKMSNYRKYVEQAMKTDNSHEIQSGEISNIIGSDSFTDKIIKQYLVGNTTDIDEREQTVLSKINAFSINDILKGVAHYFELDALEQITIRHGSHSDARKFAMFLAGKHCQRCETQSFLAKTFNISLSGFNMSRNRFKNELTNKTKSIIEKIEAGIK